MRRPIAVVLALWLGLSILGSSGAALATRASLTRSVGALAAWEGLAAPELVHRIQADSEFPTPPEPPASGPGSPNTAFPGFRATRYGQGRSGFWIVEATTGPKESDPLAAASLPVVIGIDGCCAGGDYTVALGRSPFWMHLARQGNVVVLPVYNAATAMDDAYRLVRDALAELATGDHAEVDMARTAVTGHSFGGPMAVVYAATAKTEGLPVPTAMFISNPCEGDQQGCVTAPDNARLPAGIKALVWVGDQDVTVGEEPAWRIWASLASVPAADKDFVRAVSDGHGQPAFVADHDTIGSDAPALGVVYGIWKLTDSLLSCAFTGADCDYALGNTPEQRFMGVWSDGTPVQELEFTDDPSPAAVMEDAPEAEASPAL